MNNSNSLFSSVSPISIVKEMEGSYLTYAMSVIVSRALPDVRDGLKPVHRRILFTMDELGMHHSKGYKKSARVVGDVMGKYHPHGDSAIYDALVRMAQPFSMRDMLITGQGNFGSMDGDAPAAMRYTECKLAKLSDTLLNDLDKDTVDFRPNYDGQELEPAVLPARYPNLLVNGANGIAVGMATSIPPHNLGEVVDASIAMVENPTIDNLQLNEIVKGPDFPTGGTIMGREGIVQGQASGRGSVRVRAKHVIEQLKENKESIVVTEIPYQVNKARLVEKIAELVRDKVVEDISDLRDESDRTGVRVVIELKRGANAEVILNQLYKHTPLQSSISYNMLALDKERPRLMGIRDILQCFIAHREDVIIRRTRYEYGKARDRAHLLAGLATAVANIDDIIAIIRNAPDPATAKEQLQSRDWPAADVKPLIELLGETMNSGDTYRLSARQAQAILELRLHRLTGLERDKINEEANDIQATIQRLVDILNNRDVMLEVLKKELREVKEQFATPRRTEISDAGVDMDIADLIQPEDMVVTISSDGYVKRQPMASFRAQRRGGKGRSVTALKDDEQMTRLFVANTHDLVFFFTSTGKVYKLRVYELPQAAVQSRGKAFVNLLPLEKGEIVQSIVAVPSDQNEWTDMSIVFATRLGMVRRTPLASFANVRSSGIHGMGLRDGDELVDAQLCSWATGELLLSSKNGQACRFSLDQLRPTASRTAVGVKGMNLKGDDKIMSMYVIPPAEAADKQASHLLSVTEKGYGKITPVEDYPAKSRGTMGVIAIKTTTRNGGVVSVVPVVHDDEVMIATGDGQIIRTKVAGISEMGRNTQGVRLFDIGKSSVSFVSRISEKEADEVAEEEGDDEPDMLEAAENSVTAEATETKTEETPEA